MEDTWRTWRIHGGRWRIHGGYMEDMEDTWRTLEDTLTHEGDEASGRNQHKNSEEENNYSQQTLTTNNKNIVSLHKYI